jgi:hypothetical protein
MSKLQEKPPALKKKIQLFKTWNFFTFFNYLFFLPSWIRIQPTKVIADPDPDLPFCKC